MDGHLISKATIFEVSKSISIGQRRTQSSPLTRKYNIKKHFYLVVNYVTNGILMHACVSTFDRFSTATFPIRSHHRATASEIIGLRWPSVSMRSLPLRNRDHLSLMRNIVAIVCHRRFATMPELSRLCVRKDNQHPISKRLMYALRCTRAISELLSIVHSHCVTKLIFNNCGCLLCRSRVQ